MGNVLARLRAARGIGLYAALALAALVALMLLGRGGESPQGRGERTALEVRLEEVLSMIDGAGEVSAMITEDESGRPVGALIVAGELWDVKTYLAVQRAVTALLDLEADSVEIIGAQGRFGGA